MFTKFKGTSSPTGIIYMCLLLLNNLKKTRTIVSYSHMIQIFIRDKLNDILYSQKGRQMLSMVDNHAMNTK